MEAGVGKVNSLRGGAAFQGWATGDKFSDVHVLSYLYLFPHGLNVTKYVTLLFG